LGHIILSSALCGEVCIVRGIRPPDKCIFRPQKPVLRMTEQWTTLKREKAMVVFFSEVKLR
jgi:hypothetical protein